MKRAFAMILLVSACTSAPPKEESPASTRHSEVAPKSSIEAKQLAAEEGAPASTELTFSKSSAQLSRTAQNNLRKFLDEAKKAGSVKEIKIISWADSEYPSTSTKKLSKAEADLAEQRSKSIVDYVKSQGLDTKFESFDMTKRPNVFQNWLRTSDSKVKNSLEAAGIPNTDTSVKVPSKAGKSIVLAITK